MSNRKVSPIRTSSDVHNALGIELTGRGWHLEAIKEFQKAIDLNPDCADAYDNLGNVFADQGKRLEALTSYLRSIELDSESATSYYNLGCLLLSHGTELSAQLFQRSIELDDDNPEAHYNLGLAQAELGKQEEAASAFLGALTLDPKDTSARLELADSLIEMGKYPAAINELRTLLKKHDHGNVLAMIQLGICYLHKGFTKEAEFFFKKALRRDPNNKDALFHLAKLRLQ